MKFMNMVVFPGMVVDGEVGFRPRLNGVGVNLFLSHVANEGLLALVLKEWIQRIFKGRIKVFVSSDIRNIAAGDIWLNNIDCALKRASFLIVLCSPYSVTRPWVNFETGSAWMKRIPVIPLCHSGQTAGTLPSPLLFFMGLDIKTPYFPESLINSIVLRAKLKKKPKISKKARLRMRREVASAIRQIAVKAPARAKSTPDRVAGILKIISTSDEKDCNYPALAKTLKMDPNVVDVYLRHLVDRRFVIGKDGGNGVPCYTTTKLGRDFLIEQNLL
jgi:predicted transcriptional regulator